MLALDQDHFLVRTTVAPRREPFGEAAEWANRSLHDQPAYLSPPRVAAASYALAGRLRPDFQIDRMKDRRIWDVGTNR